jgi:hypothetical protein
LKAYSDIFYSKPIEFERHGAESAIFIYKLHWKRSSIRLLDLNTFSALIVNLD